MINTTDPTIILTTTSFNNIQAKIKILGLINRHNKYHRIWPRRGRLNRLLLRHLEELLTQSTDENSDLQTTIMKMITYRQTTTTANQTMEDALTKIVTSEASTKQSGTTRSCEQHKEWDNNHQRVTPTPPALPGS